MIFVLETQGLPGRADVVAALGVVAEVTRAKEPGVAEVEVGDRKISPDTGLLDCRYILASAVPGVPSHMAESQAPPNI